MSAERSEAGGLIEGIAEDARQEADKIRSEAQQQAEEIVKGAKKRAKQTLAEAEERGEEQVSLLHSKNRQTIEAEQRKLRLKAEERLFDKAMKMIHRRLAKLREEEDYGDILQGLIAEAAIGLSVEKALVYSSQAERDYLSKEFLRRAEEEIRSYGPPVSLEAATEAKVSGQGVVVEDEDGRLSYNNTMEARLQRYAAQLRRMIYEEISEG